MKKLAAIVEKHFDGLGWQYFKNEKEGTFNIGSVKTENGILEVCINCDESEGVLIIHSELPFIIPVTSTPLVYDLVNRINNSIIFGRFCLDPEMGIISNRTCNYYPLMEINQETITRLFRENIGMLNHYIPAIMDVVCKRNIPALAFLEKQ